MPNWTLGVILGTAAAAAILPGPTRETVSLLDGKPVSSSMGQGKVSVSFDGSDGLVVADARGRMTLSARTPSTFCVSPDGRLAILNFGNGSGQVYNLDVYHLSTKRILSLASFRRHLISYARRHSCSAKADQISIVFGKWIGRDSIFLKTEDFTRRPGCSSLNRSWKLDLPHLSS
jgi:hypothetical protein